MLGVVGKGSPSSPGLKKTSRDEATSDSEKIKPVALAVIKLRLSEGIRQSVENSVE